jgi:P-type Cu+ transporter
MITPTLEVARSSQGTQQLTIQGASCASCVNKIKTALCDVLGVENAEMNLAQRTASVTGSASTEAIVEAIQQIGYDAQSLENKSVDDILDEREQADLAYYNHLIRDTFVALGLGVPLMIYGLFIGEMTVTTTTERLAWLVIGFLTFAVMASSGRHFYVGG